MYPVSALIPCYNETDEAIAVTTHSALLAGCDDIVLIDDGSCHAPETAAYVRHYTHEENMGIGAALNTAMAHARYDNLCWLSVGDTWHPDKFEHQSPSCPASFTDYIDGPTGDVRKVLPEWRRRIWYDNGFCSGTTMVSRAVMDRIGGWSESLRYSVDWQFVLEVEKLVGWKYIPKVLATCGEFAGGHSDRADWDEKNRDHGLVAGWSVANRKASMRHG